MRLFLIRTCPTYPSLCITIGKTEECSQRWETRRRLNYNRSKTSPLPPSVPALPALFQPGLSSQIHKTLLITSFSSKENSHSRISHCEQWGGISKEKSWKHFAWLAYITRWWPGPAEAAVGLFAKKRETFLRAATSPSNAIGPWDFPGTSWMPVPHSPIPAWACLLLYSLRRCWCAAMKLVGFYNCGCAGSPPI